MFDFKDDVYFRHVLNDFSCFYDIIQVVFYFRRNVLRAYSDNDVVTVTNCVFELVQDVIRILEQSEKTACNIERSFDNE